MSDGQNLSTLYDMIQSFKTFDLDTKYFSSLIIVRHSIQMWKINPSLNKDRGRYKRPEATSLFLGQVYQKITTWDRLTLADER